MYYSQIGQDKFVDQFFNHKENGIFIDVGANDGVTLSNTYFLELNRNWTGICIEPRMVEFEKLVKNRKCKFINFAISDYQGTGEFYDIQGYPEMLSGLKANYEDIHLQRVHREYGLINTINIKVNTLQHIFDLHNLYDIDYCSIDVEGSELSVVKSIDFNKTNIKLFTIENNYGNNDVENYLKQFGYIIYKKLEFDDIFILG